MSSASKKKLSVEEKHELINEIKKRPLIWDLGDAKHSNNTAIAAAWKQIAATMNVSVDVVKSSWSSLRDSRRYHLNASTKRKSGDSGGVALEQPVMPDASDWEFGEALSFLPLVGFSKRAAKYYCYHEPCPLTAKKELIFCYEKA